MKGLSQQNLNKIHVFESNCNKQNDVIKKNVFKTIEAVK